MILLYAKFIKSKLMKSKQRETLSPQTNFIITYLFLPWFQNRFQGKLKHLKKNQSFALRSHDQFKASHWSTLLPFLNPSQSISTRLNQSQPISPHLSWSQPISTHLHFVYSSIVWQPSVWCTWASRACAI